MRILIVEDDGAIRKGIARLLQQEGMEVAEASNGEEALFSLEKGSFEIILSDVRMPVMDGLTFLSRLKTLEIDIPVIMMTAYATVEEAVEAMRQGAEDYLTKPLNPDALLMKIARLTAHHSLMIENRRLKSRLEDLEFPEMVGVSKAIQQVQKKIIQLEKDPDVTVMIYGESGTGKELVARAIHRSSSRRNGPFVDVNCAAFTQTLLESELFGYKKGAFTGAVTDRKGLIVSADRGTFFMDEVGEMSNSMQSKMLRVLQEGHVQPVGATDAVAVDVRIIGASNTRLDELVAEKKFREDLYYRLNVVEITVPPLRSRQEDIPLLIAHFLKQHQKKHEARQFSREAMEACMLYRWPGNVRELENIVRRLIVTADSRTIEPDHLPAGMRGLSAPLKRSSGPPLKHAVEKARDNAERITLIELLRSHQGNVTATARALDISRVALHKKLNRLGINRSDYQ